MIVKNVEWDVVLFYMILDLSGDIGCVYDVKMMLYMYVIEGDGELVY